MQDRFKFRFFDKDKKIMIKPSPEMSDTEWENVCKTYGNDEWWWCVEAGMPTIFNYFDTDEYEKKDFVIMQSTGLKDKNGKLIYEGDILGDIYGSLYVHYCNQCKQFQLYAQGYGCMACNGDIHWIEVVEDNKKLEIIGNIYENKELLNEIHS